jgi:hypothetical protein
MRKTICAKIPNSSDNNDNDNDDAVRGFLIPAVTIKTGLTTTDGREEALTEYLCDHPDCPNIATQSLGCVREVGAIAVCDEHKPSSRA